MANRTTLVPEKAGKPAKKYSASRTNNSDHAERERVFDLFRRWGYYEATLTPSAF